jgi:hypothetical protein
MSEDKPKGFVVCRQASDPLKPNYVRGVYDCSICKKPLQVSPTAIDALRKHNMLTLCNACGFAMVKRLEEAGQTMEAIYTPDFLKSFASYKAGRGVP